MTVKISRDAINIRTELKVLSKQKKERVKLYLPDAFQQQGNLVTNGSFDTTDTSYWSSNSFTTISGNGVASIDGTGSSNQIALRNSSVFIKGVVYLVSIVCSSHTSGNLSVYLNNVEQTEQIDGIGTYNYNVIGDGDGRLQFLVRSGNTILSLSSILVTRLVWVLPKNLEVDKVFIDGDLAREGANYDYRLITDGITNWLEKTTVPAASTEIAVIGEYK